MGLKQFVKGQKFEQEFAEILSKNGFHVVILPKQRDGSQPFDIIAQKNNKAYNFDCKTLAKNLFPLSRVEDNQERAFNKLEKCGTYNNYFAIKDKYDRIYICEARVLIVLKKAGDNAIIPIECGTLLSEWLEQC